MADSLVLNQPAPDFALPADNEEIVRLSTYRGISPVLVFFYPGDFTPTCTKEVCDFRDDYHLFQQRNVEILGISGDTVEKHRRFANACNVPFRLLSDNNLTVARQWNALGLLGITRRAYFLVDIKGVLVWQHTEVLPIFRLPNRLIIQAIDKNLGLKTSEPLNGGSTGSTRHEPAGMPPSHHP